METFELILLISCAVIFFIVSICLYCNNFVKPHQYSLLETHRKERCSSSPKKEGFASSGTEGAVVSGDSIVGPNMYASHIIDNNKTWKDLIETAKKDKIASDGPGTLGAGKGQGFDKELKNQSAYNTYLDNPELIA